MLAIEEASHQLLPVEKQNHIESKSFTEWVCTSQHKKLTADLSITIGVAIVPSAIFLAAG